MFYLQNTRILYSLVILIRSQKNLLWLIFVKLTIWKFWLTILHLNKNPNKPTCWQISQSFSNSNVLEIGLSDFHKMSLTVMRVCFVKQTPKVVHYRDYKMFYNDLFRNDILPAQALTDTKKNVQTNIVNIFNEHAPLKKWYVRANQAPYMNKKLSKEVMKRSRLRNKFLKLKLMQTEKLAINNKKIIVYPFFAEKRNPFSITYRQKRSSIINVSGKLFSRSS